MVIGGFDLAPRKCGWCFGDGSAIPTAGAFRLLNKLDDDLGRMLEEFRVATDHLLDRYRPGVVMIEKPILPGSGEFKHQVMGSLLQRRAQFCMGPFLEWMCLRRGIICQEADPSWVKAALGVSRKDGDSKAQKRAMVAAAEKLGIRLPKTLDDGREDAADAVGCWKVGVRYHAPQFLPAWDRKVFAPRGALI